MKKQIVFIEYIPTIYSFKFARALKLSGNYETILVSFSKIEENFYKQAYNRIINIEAKHKVNPKNIIRLVGILFSKQGRNFINQIRKLNPRLFQITGPDLFTMLSIFLIKKKVPKIYLAYDIWAFFEKKWSFKNIGIKEFFQKNFEKICFKRCDAILHKGPKDELKLLDFPINKPDLSLIPGCLDEWTYLPKNKKKSKEIHLVYAGGPLAFWKGRFPFIEVIRIITSQKIHMHTYGNCVIDSDNIIFLNESKTNKYFHFHAGKTPDSLNKEISKYDYGIFPDFYNTNIINPLWPKTSMANKFFNYLEAGLPIIISRPSQVMSDIVEKERVGITINFEDLKNLKKILEKQDYKRLQKNVKKAQDKMKISRIIKELEDFYDKIAKSKSVQFA